ncbi:two-component system chemotaxis response regulator CheB [Nocardia tenerifensis]|uniref:protein-glutamate methylesterase n=1 Tax=Nocardia tenerifensis TaxID=228006 RepID=A0A318KPQ3_9NOCA|nr:chemotaxis protein CheB [Nocardia tenerifensis]PXX71630.1 two-component system chemotaxis response regulator CheB [Nocardia tenerifensis]
MTTPPANLIVVGASAGGVEALRDFVGGLPADLSAAVLVVLHLPRRGPSALASILRRVGTVPVDAAENGEPLVAGRVYTAVPDHHLLVADGRILLSNGPTENGHRPGIDALFRSAAVSWGPRVAGVVLSGTLDDGTAGLTVIRARGGLTAVQDPEDANYPSMPENALAAMDVDLVLPAEKLGRALVEQLRTRTVATPAPVSQLDALEARIDAGERNSTEEVKTMMPASGLICPDCGGPLFTAEPDRRFRCRIGHAWTAEALLLEEHLEVERALWSALRLVQEKRELADRMHAAALDRGQDLLAETYAERGAEHSHTAEVLRRLLGPRSA